MTFTSADVAKVFADHGMVALASSPAFIDHARWANDEAKKHGVEAGWDYLYWHARQDASINGAESAAAEAA